MTEFDLPITLTYGSPQSAYEFIQALEAAKEDVTWEQLKADDGSIIVRVLNIISQAELAEKEGA
jgi:hypothetical protein